MAHVLLKTECIDYGLVYNLTRIVEYLMQTLEASACLRGSNLNLFSIDTLYFVDCLSFMHLCVSSVFSIGDNLAVLSAAVVLYTKCKCSFSTSYKFIQTFCLKYFAYDSLNWYDELIVYFFAYIFNFIVTSW